MASVELKREPIYNDGLGAEPGVPIGVQGQSPWSTVKAEAILVLDVNGNHKFTHFLQFGNAKKSYICVIFAKKITGGHETGRPVACLRVFVAKA